MTRRKRNKLLLEDKDSKAVFICICAVLSFISCMVLRYFLIIENYLKSFVITLLFLIPTVISICLIILNKRKKLKLETANIIQILIILPSIIYIFFLTYVSLLIELKDGGVNNVINYRRVYSYNRLDYFPKKIPKSAKNIAFHYNPPLFQGGEIFSLYLKCNKNIINEYENKYQKYKLEKNEINENEIGVFKESFYFTPYGRDYDKINDFKIYLIYKECDDSIYCNHGIIKSIAINENTSEIIFYYSNW